MFWKGLSGFCRRLLSASLSSRSERCSREDCSVDLSVTQLEERLALSMSPLHWYPQTGPLAISDRATAANGLADTSSVAAEQRDPETSAPAEKCRLHRLAEVRRRQRLSRRTVAQRMNVDVSTICEQEQGTADLQLSTLYQWQKVLGVPVAELLVEDDEALSPPIMKRAQMVRVMKTALSILERANQASIRCLAQNLVNQLQEMMPDLAGIRAWNLVGRKRSPHDYGQAALRCLSRDMSRDLTE